VKGTRRFSSLPIRSADNGASSWVYCCASSLPGCGYSSKGMKAAGSRRHDPSELVFRQGPVTCSKSESNRPSLRRALRVAELFSSDRRIAQSFKSVGTRAKAGRVCHEGELQ